MSEPGPERIHFLRQGLDRLRGDVSQPPEGSVVVPVNAQGDLDNTLNLLTDLSAYAGGRSLEVVLVVNNYADGEPPTAADQLRRAGAVVVAVSNVRRRGYAVPLMGRWHGLKAARSDKALLFDADCRIPAPTALIDWYLSTLDMAGVAYTKVDFYDLGVERSVRMRRFIHHAARWCKRVILRVPTTRGSNYAVRRDAMLTLFDAGAIADDMNVGPVFKRAGRPVVYSGARAHVVLTSGRMIRGGGWRRLLSYARYRLRYNLRMLPVRPDAARRTGKDDDPVRRYIDNKPVR
jgi:hypothetical protein